MNDLAEQILAILCRIAPDVDAAAVDRGTPLVDQLDLDSMDYQNLLAALSTQYGIPIPESDVARLRSIDDLAEYVRSHERPGALRG